MPPAIQNWMRDYDPTLGRYLQADPLGLVDGASVHGYVRQNPGRLYDPRGMQALEDSFAGFAANVAGATPFRSSGQPFVPYRNLPMSSRQTLSGRMTWMGDIFAIYRDDCKMMVDPARDAVFFCPPDQTPFDGTVPSRANCIRYMPPGTGSGATGNPYASNFPFGYYVYYNASGQVISPYSGGTVSPSSSAGHTPATTPPILLPSPTGGLQ